MIAVLVLLAFFAVYTLTLVAIANWLTDDDAPDPEQTLAESIGSTNEAAVQRQPVIPFDRIRGGLRRRARLTAASGTGVWTRQYNPMGWTRRSPINARPPRESSED